MTIDALPEAPSTSDPTNFATEGDAFLAALATFVSQANALAVAMNLNSTTDTSASSVAIGTGAKSFTVSTGKSFQPGMWLVIADTAAPSTNQMIGTVTSYNAATGALVMSITAVLGSGTKTAWSISQSSSGGAIAGPLATSGITGAAASGANSDITSVLSSVSGMVLLSTGTASASATLDFTGLTGYASYLFVLDSVRPTTDAQVLYARISTDNGATYKAGASDYRYSGTETTSAGGTGVGSSAGAAQISVGFAVVSNNSSGGVSGEVSLVGAASTSKLKRVGFKVGCSINSAGIASSETGEGFYITDTNAINAMRFLYTSGTIADGVIRVYGIKG